MRRDSKSPLYQPGEKRESEDPPRKQRVRVAPPLPEMPAGWRASRRSTGALKKVRRGVRLHGLKEAAVQTLSRARRGARHGAYIAGVTAAALAASVAVLLVVSLAINGVARWNAERVASLADTEEARTEKARDNLLIVAVDEKGHARGFLAIRVDGDTESIYGIAIPDGAFIEVPGQGFERIGASWEAGPDVSLDAVSNFFGVPFTAYASVDPEVYQAALTGQTFTGVSDALVDTNMDGEAAERFAEAFASTPTERVALVPLPVKPITLGSQTYFEPQRDQIADLVETWWDVRINGDETPTRVIVYNGAGVPGIAGTAAQELIRGGLRVVDTKNADRFDYETTSIIVQNGPVAVGEEIRTVLGVGKVLEQPADQQIADVIVIIGKDYRPEAQQ